MRKSNVEITIDQPEAVMFKTSCACGLPECQLEISVDRDENPNFTTVMLFTKSIWDDSLVDDIYKKILGRIKAAFNILFRGNLEIDSCFTFRNADHFKEFKDVLEEAINQVEGKDKKDNI